MHFTNYLRLQIRILKRILLFYSKSEFVKYFTILEVQFAALLITSRLFQGEKVESKKKLIFSAPDNGNIGDQLMLLATLNAIKGDFQIISENSKAINILNFEWSDSIKYEIPNLYHRLPGLGFKTIFKVAKLIKNADSIYIIGADLMDGKYNYAASLHRLQILHLAKKLSIKSRVLGFSWSDESYNSLINYMKTCCQSTKFYVRDPKSFSRISKHKIANLENSADIVFSLEIKASQHSEEKEKYIVVNASGLISGNTSTLQIYRSIISQALNKEYRIILLPHVIRDSDDDLSILKELYKGYEYDSRINFVKSLLHPYEISKICADATIVVTSRMHLSILSLMAGTPPLTFSSNGKVEGLLALFEIESLAIPEFTHNNIEIFAKFEKSLTDNLYFRAKIQKNIDKVTGLSKKNFED